MCHSTEQPSVDFIFHYLIAHDLDEAVEFFDPGKRNGNHPVHTISRDLIGELTLATPDGPLQVTLQPSGVTYTAKVLRRIPGTDFKPINNEVGTFFSRPREAPVGRNDCWVSQYPPRVRGELELPGRTIVEFFTPEGITGVFKTNVDNNGASGVGDWDIPN